MYVDKYIMDDQVKLPKDEIVKASETLGLFKLGIYDPNDDYAKPDTQKPGASTLDDELDIDPGKKAAGIKKYAANLKNEYQSFKSKVKSKKRQGKDKQGAPKYRINLIGDYKKKSGSIFYNSIQKINAWQRKVVYAISVPIIAGLIAGNAILAKKNYDTPPDKPQGELFFKIKQPYSQKPENQIPEKLVAKSAPDKAQPGKEYTSTPVPQSDASKAKPYQKPDSKKGSSAVVVPKPGKSEASPKKGASVAKPTIEDKVKYHFKEFVNKSEINSYDKWHSDKISYDQLKALNPDNPSFENWYFIQEFDHTYKDGKLVVNFNNPKIKDGYTLVNDSNGLHAGNQVVLNDVSKAEYLAFKNNGVLPDGSYVAHVTNLDKLVKDSATTQNVKAHSSVRYLLRAKKPAKPAVVAPKKAPKTTPKITPQDETGPQYDAGRIELEPDTFFFGFGETPWPNVNDMLDNTKYYDMDALDNDLVDMVQAKVQTYTDDPRVNKNAKLIDSERSLFKEVGQNSCHYFVDHKIPWTSYQTKFNNGVLSLDPDGTTYVRISALDTTPPEGMPMEGVYGFAEKWVKVKSLDQGLTVGDFFDYFQDGKILTRIVSKDGISLNHAKYDFNGQRGFLADLPLSALSKFGKNWYSHHGADDEAPHTMFSTRPKIFSDKDHLRPKAATKTAYMGQYPSDHYLTINKPNRLHTADAVKKWMDGGDLPNVWKNIGFDWLTGKTKEHEAFKPLHHKHVVAKYYNKGGWGKVPIDMSKVSDLLDIIERHNKHHISDRDTVVGVLKMDPDTSNEDLILKDNERLAGGFLMNTQVSREAKHPKDKNIEFDTIYEPWNLSKWKEVFGRIGFPHIPLGGGPDGQSAADSDGTGIGPQGGETSGNIPGK